MRVGITVLSIGFVTLSALSKVWAAPTACVVPADAATFDRATVVSSAVEATWDPKSFSDPTKHDGQKYRYIVHMFDLYSSHYGADGEYRFLMHKVANNPCSTISVSIITQDKHWTFGNIGFILRVPMQNYLLSKSSDMGSADMDANADAQLFNSTLTSYARMIGPLETSDQILQETDRSYNEILIEGKSTESIQVIGIAIQNSAMSGTYEAELRDGAIAVAKQYGLPIVVIGN